MKVTVRVHELVAARGWDAQDLARQAGLDDQTAQTLSDGGAMELDKAELGRLSAALGVLPHEILATVDEKQPSAIDVPAPRDPHVPTATEPAPPSPGESSHRTPDTREA